MTSDFRNFAESNRLRNSFILLLSLCMACCKAKQGVIQNSISTDLMLNSTCVLSNLPKTTNYRNEIEEFTKIYKDTVIQMENKKIGSVIYNSIFDLRPSSHFLWLIKESKGKKDSLLIQALSNSKSVETYFDMERCELEKIVTEFHANGDPKMGYTTFIKFEK